MSIFTHLPEGLNNAFEYSSKALFLEPGQQINDFNEFPNEPQRSFKYLTNAKKKIRGEDMEREDKEAHTVKRSLI